VESSKSKKQAHPLAPLRPITVITEVGPTVLPIEEISVERIGWKAYGLSSLPQAWVPPFFVITASCFEGNYSDETIDVCVADCIASTAINAGRSVIVRSSGTSETMRYRGQLKSKYCLSHQVASTIRSLIPQLPKMIDGKVHWIVQEYVTPKEKGHLSNERRLKYEKRDWVVEFEPQGDRYGYTVPLAVRHWRDGTGINDLALRCISEVEVTLRLKSVAIWATQLSSRIHFEWVWEGEAVYIVQAQEEEPASGVEPSSLLPIQINSVAVSSLNVFHPANQRDFERYGKLRNAKLYGELGYHMPVFYVTDDTDVVQGILSGEIPSNLEADLVELTKRPLIIRTDGGSIPGDKSEMLPRSDELRSYDEARDWLLNEFKSRVEQSGLRDSDLCLIAHHFIPSVASAWARAEPGNRVVRIESLWGIPEGLYWYSHDTFEVDTQTVDVDFGLSTKPLKYKCWERLRYKGTFIAPNEDGKWMPYQTTPPYDWNKSISKKSWLFEIAHTTRQVAEREKYAVSVMWFIDNHRQATEHRVLPWFHSKSELAGPPKAAPRQKRKSASDFTIRNVADWQQMQEDIQSGKHIERVVVEPIDTALIRNPEFAKDLADLAASKRIVVALSGGILSHSYYILQSRGAQVECLDLFGADEDIVGYNKLVRDKIPEVIGGRGERAETVQLKGDALVLALRQKLVEEAYEALDAKSGTDLIGELADIQEVVRALGRALGVNTTEIEAEREEKEKRRGGFEKGFMLTKTATPHSIQKQPSSPESPTLMLKSEISSEPVISDVLDLPGTSLYRRPDLRQFKHLLEKLFTFETEINKMGEIKQTLDFAMPIDNERQLDFTLGIELRRMRSVIRGVVRLQLNPLQLEIEFPEEKK
jgi:predicted house-cleaning noncanonical NTP pyrophosphatase (MazG superfamily)